MATGTIFDVLNAAVSKQTPVRLARPVTQAKIDAAYYEGVVTGQIERLKSGQIAVLDGSRIVLKRGCSPVCNKDMARRQFARGERLCNG